MKLLTVDDSAMMRRIISDAGEAIGFEAVGAANGADALAVLEKRYQEINLVLLDWNMPGISGLDVLRRIKAHPQWSGIPVMMVTTESERRNILKAIQEGAANYLTKPFATEDLITKILQTTGQGG